MLADVDGSTTTSTRVPVIRFRTTTMVVGGTTTKSSILVVVVVFL